MFVYTFRECTMDNTSENLQMCEMSENVRMGEGEITRKIVEHVMKSLCDKCKHLHVARLSGEIHNYCSRSLNGTIGNENDALRIWLACVPAIRLADYGTFVELIQGIPEVIENMDVFLRVARLLRFFPTLSEFTPHILRLSIRLSLEFPCITIKEFEDAFRKLAVHHPIYSPVSLHVWETYSVDSSLIEWENKYTTRIHVIHLSHIHPAWYEWEMDTLEYASFVQWLPREMMEDVTQLTTQRESP